LVPLSPGCDDDDDDADEDARGCVDENDDGGRVPSTVRPTSRVLRCTPAPDCSLRRCADDARGRGRSVVVDADVNDDDDDDDDDDNADDDDEVMRERDVARTGVSCRALSPLPPRSLPSVEPRPRGGVVGGCCWREAVVVGEPTRPRCVRVGARFVLAVTGRPSGRFDDLSSSAGAIVTISFVSRTV
jgi:hypothetical protein